MNIKSLFLSLCCLLAASLCVLCLFAALPHHVDFTLEPSVQASDIPATVIPQASAVPAVKQVDELRSVSPLRELPDPDGRQAIPVAAADPTLAAKSLDRELSDLDDRVSTLEHQMKNVLSERSIMRSPPTAYSNPPANPTCRNGVCPPNQQAAKSQIPSQAKKNWVYEPNAADPENGYQNTTTTNSVQNFAPCHRWRCRRR